jgi:anthranilate phosphoribosyltransferase
LVKRSNSSFSPEHLRFLEYIRCVGTGPKGNRHLSYDEMSDAFELIVQRRVPDVAISAFLLGWRVQIESDEELSSCVDWLALQQASLTKTGIEIGYPFDGKAKFFPIMLKAAELLDDLEIHTAYDLPLGPKYGVTLDQFENISSNVTLHNRCDFLKGLSDLTTLRNDIGIRTAFNTLEKLNFLAPSSLIGMHHAPYFDLYASLYTKHYTRLVIVQGHEGTPEVLKKTKYKLVENGEITTHHIDPQEFGIESISAKEIMSLETMQELMDNPDENLAKMIRLNAAFLGWSAGKFETIEKGMMCLQD